MLIVPAKEAVGVRTSPPLVAFATKLKLAFPLALPKHPLGNADTPASEAHT